MQYLENLLDELDRSRERLLVALELLPDEALLAAEAVQTTAGPLSIADCLALQTAWEAELVTAFMRLDRGQKPDKLLQALAHIPTVEARWLAENRTRDLDAIFRDFQQVRVQLEEWLEGFSEKDFTNPRRYPWLKGRSLTQLIASLTYEREADYLPAVETFARQWLEAEAPPYLDETPSAGLLIPLTAVAPPEENNHDHQPD